MRMPFFRITFFVLVCVSIPFTTTAQTVNIPDPNLHAVIEAALDKASDDLITAAEMETLTSLEAGDASISDLTGLEFAINLTGLNLDDNFVSDISSVAGLTTLTWLNLGNNSVSDMSPLAGLTNLSVLYLWGNSASDISPLARLTNLIELGLGNNSISDISPLTELTNLTSLYLGNNSISDISPLTELINLTELNLDDNSISDIPPLTGLINLISLDLQDNSISDISPLADLTNLGSLSLTDNLISDISPLAGLATLTGLNLVNNSIWDISPLAGLTNLKWLFVGGNSISDISPLMGLTNLRDLDLGGNSLSDISALAGLINLMELDLVHNSISDLSPLAGLTNLKWLWLYDNAISDISALVANTGLGAEDIVGLRENSLNYPSIDTYIPVLRTRGVSVRFRHRTPTTILNISGYQRGSPSATLNPFVVEVRDEYGSAFEGVPVTFAVTAGDGTLSVTHTTTEENGRAQSTLTLGQNLGVHTVSATAAGLVIDDPVIFNVISDTEPPPIATDVNGDGVVNLLDLVLVASAFGSEVPDLTTDINGDGVVNMLDLVWVADALGAAPAAPSLQPQVLEMLTAEDVKLWLSQAYQLDLTDAASLKGILFLEQLLAALLPRETALLPNYPNPFNPETWIPYRLAEDALVTLTIYDGSGQVVRTLDVGHQVAAFYETRSKAIHWDGRNKFGEQVASGVYFYHLSAGDYSATRKMLILK